MSMAANELEAKKLFDKLFFLDWKELLSMGYNPAQIISDMIHKEEVWYSLICVTQLSSWSLASNMR